jgi:hypothetical protein
VASFWVEKRPTVTSWTSFDVRITAVMDLVHRSEF